MPDSFSLFAGKFSKPLVWSLFLGVTILCAWLTQDYWQPMVARTQAYLENRQQEPDAAEHDHSDAAHGSAPDTLTLSSVAWKNIGVTTGIARPSDYVKFVSVPAIVTERPGRSQIEITAHVTSNVTRVYLLPQQTVQPGQKLFDLRLTHEDIVAAQSEFLKRLQALDLADKELKRLKGIGDDIIPGKRIIEQEYKRDEARTALEALRQSLLLHDLTEKQISEIEKTRKVLKEITVIAPPFSKHDEFPDLQHRYHVQSINVNRGQSVAAGELLGVLADHCLLYLEGQAFNEDAERLIDVSMNGQMIHAVPLGTGSRKIQPLPLKIQSVADQVDRDSRALKFYLLLPNEKIETSVPNGTSFVAWKYRPGQRMEARIPTTEVLKNKIVLPASAVAIEGPNAFVFEQNGNNFDRIDVQVLFRDKDTVVLENNPHLVGSMIALTGAYDMHLALENQSGGAIDPHAGHSH